MNIQTLGLTGLVVGLVSGVCDKVKTVWPAVAVNSSEIGRIAAAMVIIPPEFEMVMAEPACSVAQVGDAVPAENNT